MQPSILLNSKANHLDRLGVAASMLCAAHCLLVPLLFTIFPLVSLNFLFEETTEWTLAGLSTALGVVSLVPACVRRHQRYWPLAFFGAGVFLLICARFWFEEWLNVEVAVAVSGAALIATAHFLNHRLCRACVRCSEQL